MKRYYSNRLHPIVLFVFFAGVILITMLTFNPILVGITFFCSMFFNGLLNGFKKLLKSLPYSLILIAIITITNPLFVHKGSTLLFFINDNPVSLEALIYGLILGMMLVSIFYWFSCYNKIFTSDKFIYLFGKSIPKLSLLLSTVLRLIPRFKKQYKAIDETQRALGIYTSKSIFERIKNRFRVLAILVTWSLENSIESGDSMRARGYGLKGRTSYSNYKWRTADSVILTLVLTLTAIVITCIFTDVSVFYYYPTFSAITLQSLPLIMYGAMFVLAALLSLLEVKENASWRLYRSKI